MKTRFPVYSFKNRSCSHPSPDGRVHGGVHGGVLGDVRLFLGCFPAARQRYRGPGSGIETGAVATKGGLSQGADRFAVEECRILRYRNPSSTARSNSSSVATA